MADQRALKDPNHNSALIVQDSTGAETRQVRSTAANPNAVSVDVLGLSPGTGASSLGKAEDSVHASGDVGVFGLAVANEAQTTLAADGDYIGHSTDTKGNNMAVGNIAAGATDAGAPVKMGAKLNTTRPTYTDGQRGDLQIGTRGSLSVQLMAADSTVAFTGAVDNADGAASSGTANKLAVVNRNQIYNGTSYDLQRGAVNGTNSTGTGLVSAAMIAQLDDTAPTAITENQFGNVRMSARRSLLIQDEAKNSLTYSASAAVTLAAAATDFFTITGSASTTVFITKIAISGIQTTGGVSPVSIIKRSTANSGGTSSDIAEIPHDSSDAAASATVLAYTANPTLGSTVGTIRQRNVPFTGTTATTNGNVPIDFGQSGRPVVLRGTGQVLALNLGGATLAGGVAYVDIEWYEV